MTYDITKQNYETANDWHSEKSMGYLWASEHAEFMKLLTAQKPKVLDVGCGGSGRDIEQFVAKGVNVEGLDYSHAAIESVKAKFPGLAFYEADMTQTGIPGEAYDGIWSCASVLNLPKADAPKAFAEFNRLLKKDGALFVSVKTGEGERMVPDKAGERFFSFYSEAEIRMLAENAGFRVDHFTNRVSRTEPQSENERFGWLCLYAKKI